MQEMPELAPQPVTREPPGAQAARTIDTRTYTLNVKPVLLNRILIVLAFIGVFVAGALSASHAMDIVLPCGQSNGCDKVLHSSLASIFGIPTAYLGLGAYLFLAAIAIFRAQRGLENTRFLVTIGYIVSALGAVFSIFLQLYSLVALHDFCRYCVGSALTMLATLVVYALLAQSLQSSEKPAAPQKLDSIFPVGVGLLTVLALAFFVVKVKADALQTGPAVPVGSESLLIPKDPHVFGDSDTPVTIVEFADLCCPSCQRFSPKVEDFVAQNKGKIHLVYRNFPLPMHRQGIPSALLAEYASDKGQFWQFAGAVWSLQKEPESIDELLAIIKNLGMDDADAKKHILDQNDPSYTRVLKDMSDGKKLLINETPSFLVVAKNIPVQRATAANLFELLNQPRYKEIMSGKS